MVPRVFEPPSFDEATRRLAEIGRRLDGRNWVLGTSGNFSAVLSRRPLALAITASGTHKGRLTRRQFLTVDADGRVVGRSGAGRPSAETLLHLELARRGAGAVLHTHSVWGTIVSDLHADARGLAIQGYEMLKGLSGVVSHDHREWLPIVENDQDMERLAGVVHEALEAHPAAHGVLLRQHGLYTWGTTLDDAARHVEVLEFLLETVGRRSAPWHE
ncbi:MAG: methylthioribulose 1-phosphate dehydratase [Acidobacteria bacterium]|nr:methylthioribulose 1-phosphate dehydratase [Acidobacteriota bacterium]